MSQCGPCIMVAHPTLPTKYGYATGNSEINENVLITVLGYYNYLPKSAYKKPIVF